MAKLIELQNVYKIYGEGLESEVRALDGVSLTIERGEFTAVVGQSGSGKSTMMNVLGCLDIPTYGDYILNGTDVRDVPVTGYREAFSSVFQDFKILSAFNSVGIC